MRATSQGFISSMNITQWIEQKQLTLRYADLYAIYYVGFLFCTLGCLYSFTFRYSSLFFFKKQEACFFLKIKMLNKISYIVSTPKIVLFFTQQPDSRGYFVNKKNFILYKVGRSFHQIKKIKPLLLYLFRKRYPQVRCQLPSKKKKSSFEQP